MGYEAATNTQIAERAETSFGSFYQFFPNKEAILEVLVERYAEELRALHDRELSVEAARLPLAVLLDRAVGSLAQFKAERPAFWPIFYGSQTSEKLSSAADELLGEVVALLALLFAVALGALAWRWVSKNRSRLAGYGTAFLSRPLVARLRERYDRQLRWLFRRLTRGQYLGCTSRRGSWRPVCACSSSGGWPRAS